ncbi:MAG: leucine-rich repeat domain-containing protein [Bacteroidaceae bacterium]|nr:leucine-rich repeat domain-containing protein [Bacteroidaceae bacterium]
MDIHFMVIGYYEVACSSNYNTGTNNRSCIDWDLRGTVTIPETVEYQGETFTVTGIYTNAFNLCSMDSLILPSTLQRIMGHSITSCPYLRHILIPRSVYQIDEGAFSSTDFRQIEVEDGNYNYCAVNGVLFNKEMTTLLQYPVGRYEDSYIIPSTVTRIGEYAFNASYLKSVTIPSSVTEIGRWGFFQNFRMDNFNIPASVTDLGPGACTGNNSITYINVDEGNPVYTSVNGVVYTRDGKTLMDYPTATPQTSYVIEEGTTEIFENAFMDAKYLEEITIPNSVTKIGASAFNGCAKLKSVDIPASVKELGGAAFDYCKNLTSVYMHSETPPTIPQYASFIFGGNSDIKVYAPYQYLAAYQAETRLTRVHIDPAIDWHDNHWTWTFTCIEGIDFSKTDGLDAYQLKKRDGDNNVKAMKVALRNGTVTSPVELEKVDKAGPGDCVILKVADPNKKYFTLVTDNEAPHLTENLLVGVTDSTDIAATEGDFTNFVFDGEKFVAATGSENVSGGLGYLKLPTDIAQAMGSEIGLDKLVPQYEMSETDDNTEAISTHSEEYANVRLDNCTLMKDGRWNAICLPFDLAITGSILDGGTAKTFTATSVNDGTLTLTFGAAVDTLRAGIPYIIKWESGENITNPTFNCVTIKNGCTPLVIGSGNSKVTFTGTFAPITLQKNSTTNLFIGAENRLRYPVVDDFSINAFQAYFQLDNASSAAETFAADFGNGEVTKIGINIAESTDDAMTNSRGTYNAAGQKVEKGYKGIIIVDGKKKVQK